MGRTWIWIPVLAAAAGCAGVAASDGGGSLSGLMLGPRVPTRSQGTARVVSATRLEALQALEAAWDNFGKDKVSRRESGLVASLAAAGEVSAEVRELGGGRVQIEVLARLAYMTEDKLVQMENNLLNGVADKIELERYRRGGKPPAPPAGAASTPPAESAAAAPAPPPAAAPKPKPQPAFNAKPDPSIDGQF